MRRWVVGLAAVLVSAGAMARGDDVPQYALEPGRVLDYEWGRVEEHGEATTKTRVWVVGRDDAGAARVVTRQTLKLTRKGTGEVAREETTFALFDVRPNGEIPSEEFLDPDVSVSAIFPRLPSTAQEAAEGWRTRDDRHDVTVTYKPIAKDQDGRAKTTFDFEADVSGAEQKVYGSASRSVYHFDRERGAIVGVESTESDAPDWKFELKAVATEDPAKLKAFGDEMALYFEAREAYREASAKAMSASGEADALSQEPRAILTDARARVTLGEPAALLDKMIKNYDEGAGRRAARAAERAKRIGKPAPDWGPTPDLDGRSQSLGQYRGKVVVLDFWYRGCGWCVKAMPQVKMLAEHYRDQPVAFFGASIDRDEKDARFVAETLKLNYPVIRSENLAEKYNVEGFPTLFVIDQKGNLAAIHVGYNPKLFEGVSESVDRLLKPAE